MPDSIHRFADQAITPWRNGHGRRADIVAGEDWSLSLAWVERAAPFSDYPNTDRILTLLEGDGFRLDFKGPPSLEVTRPEQPTAFPGDVPTECTPFGSASLVLNLMARRGRWRPSVQVVPMAGEVALTPLGGPCVATVLAGEVTLPDGRTVGRLDTVGVPGRLVLQGAAARLAVARLQPV
jgi:environmental stress-induced protein Ves